MSSDGRTFRVFVSSTFEDFKLERDALQRRVFPDLQRLCAERGARFQAIDLRWGVSEDAARDQQTMALCLQEIERCRQSTPRPNFIALLGDRYGWRPLPREIPEDRFRMVVAAADAQVANLLETWYWKDSNAVPPARTLRSRVEVAERGDSADWTRIEQHLRDAIEVALGRLPSATEQEICAGVLAPAYEVDSAFAFVRQIDGMPRGVQAQGYLDLDEDGRPDPRAQAQRANLEARLRSSLKDHVFTYRARWTGVDTAPVTTDHLDQLCEDVHANLRDAINRELSERKKRDSLELELEAHERAARSHGSHVLGREAEVHELLACIDDPASRVCIVQGPWGSGKTALLGHLVQTLSQQRPGVTSVYRFIAEAPAAAALRKLLEGLLRQLARHLHQDVTGLATVDDLVRSLRDLLVGAGRAQGLVLLLDGVDLLADSDSARTYHWLPSEIPDGVTVVLSCTNSDDAQVLSQRFPGARLIRLGGLPVASALEMLRSILARARRRLQAAQWQAVGASLAAHRLPMFVELIGEEIRDWRSFDNPGPLPTDVEALVGRHRERLAEGRRHGGVLLERCLGYLGAGLTGLAEDELLAVLSGDSAVMGDFRSRNPRAPDVASLPVIVWSRLRSDLNRYIRDIDTDGTTLLTFRHRQVEELLQGDRQRDPVEFHSRLLHYFACARAGEAGRGHRRALAELPYQQRCAGDWTALESTLTDVHFLEDKLSAGLGLELLEDFERLRDCGMTADPRIERCLQMGRAFANVFDFVRDAPNNLGPQIHLELQAGDPDTAKTLLFRVEESCADRVWLQRYVRRTSASAWHEAQTGFDQPFIQFMRFSPDGEALLYGDANGRLTRWHWRTGARTSTTPLANAPDRGWFKYGALASGSAFAFASSSTVWVLRIDDVWVGDLQRGVWQRACTATTSQSFEALADDAASGHFLLAVRDESGSLLWELDPEGCTVLARRRIPNLNPRQMVNHVAAAPGGRPRALCLDTGHLIVSSGLTVRAHGGGALHCGFLPEGCQVATCGVDGTLAIHDPTRGLVSRVELAFGEAECLACAPSGRLVAVGHRDGQVSVVDRAPPMSVHFFSPGIAGWVLSLAFSDSGRFLAVGGRNGGAKVFDIEKAQHSSSARHLPRGDAVAATRLGDEGPCVFEDGGGYLFSTSPRVDTAQLPLRIVTHCVDRERGVVLAVLNDRLRALDPRTGAIEYEQTIQVARRYSAACSSDGSTLALLEQDGVALFLWNDEGRQWSPLRKLSILAGDGFDGGAWRADVPLLLSRDARWLALALETRATGESRGGVFEAPPLARKIVVLDTATGARRLAIPYQGFCTALLEWPDADALTVAFGDGPVHFPDGGFVWHHGDRGVRVHSLTDGELLRRLDTPEVDLGITGLALHPTLPLVASTSRAGYLRLAPLRGRRWEACVRLPASALAPRFDAAGCVVWVADDGRTNSHWPVEHEFLIKFSRSREPGEE